MKRIIKRYFILFFVLFIFSIITISYLRYEALKRISDFIKIYGTFSSLDLKPLPPSLSVTGLTIEIPDKLGKLNVKNAGIEVTTKGLFSKKLIFRVKLESPQFTLYKLERGKGKKRKLPNFEIENGRIVNGSFIFKDEKREIVLDSINGSLYYKNKRLALNIKDSVGKINEKKMGFEREFFMRLLLRAEKDRIRVRELEIKNEFGTISTRGMIYSKDETLEVEGEINSIISPIKYKGIEIKGNMEGSYRVEGINGNMKGKIDFSFSNRINGKLMNTLVSANFDEKFNGEAHLRSTYKKFPWFCDIKFSEGKFFNFNLQNFPLELFDSTFPYIPSDSFLNFDGEIRRDKLNGQFLLLSDEGTVKGNINSERKEWNVNVEEIKLKGLQGYGLINSNGKNIDISGEIKDFSLKEILNSKTLKHFYTPSNLPPIDGVGNAILKISGTTNNPETDAEIYLKNFKIGNIDIGNINGKIKGVKDNLAFEASLKDGIFEGLIRGNLKERVIQIEIERARGEKFLKELKGELKGDLIFYFRDGIEVRGKIFSQLLRFGRIELREVSIPINFKDEIFTLTPSFSTGLSNVSGELILNRRDMKYKVSVPQISFDISKINEDFKGELSLSLKGEGKFYDSPMEIKGKIKDFSYKSGEPKSFDLNCNAFFSKDKISIKGVAETTAKDEYLDFDFFIIEGGYLEGKFNGNINGIEKLIEFPGESIKAKFIGEVKGKLNSLQIKSISNVEGKSFFIRGFAHEFKDFSGTLIQENDSLHLRNFRAKIGGGDVEGYGEAKIGRWTLENIKVNVTGKDMRLSPFERVRGVGDGKIEIRGNLEEITIEGSFSIKSLFWRKEIGEKIAFSSTPSKGPPKIFKKINLNIELHADGNAWMENSWGKAEGKFSLRIKGDSSNPIILGNIKGRKGELNIGDRKFKLIRAEVYFNSPFIIDPEIYILADTFVKDYRVTFEVKGKASKPLPQLSSSPPLPSQDILTLLAIGEIYQRTTYRTGTQFSSASLLSMEISEQLKTRAKKLFGVDRLRVDPYLLGSSSNPVARLTVGKKVSKDLIVLYSSDLTGQREYIVYIEYSISENLSLIGMRNENGAFSIDLKFIKRLGQ